MIELQRKLIGDAVRNDAFARALKSVILPKITTLLDLGSGTGFLSFVASRLGAARCTLVEVDKIIEVSKALAKRNNIKNCTFVNAHSTDLSPKTQDKVDVLVSETLGNHALEENIIETIEDAKRFLKPNATIIPSKISQFVRPVTSSRLHKEIDVWAEAGARASAGLPAGPKGLKFDEARELTLNNMYVRTVLPADMEGEWHTDATKSAVASASHRDRPFDVVDFSKKNASLRKAKIAFRAGAPLTVYGLALWWEAELVPGLSLSTSPFAAATHWEQIYLPMLEAVPLQAAEVLEVTVASDTRWDTKISLGWAVRRVSASGQCTHEQKMDMQRGYIP